MLQVVHGAGIENSAPSVRISGSETFPFRGFATMEPLQSTLLAHLGQVPDFRHARGQRFAWAYLPALAGCRPGAPPHPSPPQSAHWLHRKGSRLWPDQRAPGVAGPAELKRFWHGHWTIENRVHYVRDETFGEGRCQLRTGAGAQALAVIRNAILSFLRFHG